MTARVQRLFTRVAAALVFACSAVLPLAPAHADDIVFQNAFDQMLGTEVRTPRTYDNPFESQILALAEASRGRVGVAAMDLSTGRTVDVLGNQRFPMASTSKIAIAAAYLDGVEKGRWTLSSEFPLLIPVSSAARSTRIAPVRKGNHLPASELIELMITRSSNTATDALLAAVGGPAAVNQWMRRAGIRDFQLDRDIATLVRDDDGTIDPASVIENRDSATPLAMVQLLKGLHEGKWLNARHREVIIGAMERCRTGTRRIPALLPQEARVAHKTGTLFNTTSDIGIIKTPDGRAFAVAIYVTGQGSRLNREARIASLARAIYDGYSAMPGGGFGRTASVLR